MSVYRRGSAWHYDFQIQGERFRGSCGDACKSKTRAKQIEDDRRGEVLAGIGGPSRKAPLLSAYSVPFLEWVDGCVKAGSLADKTGKYYHNGLRLLSATPAWNMRLDKITSEVAAMLTFPGPASGNQALRVLHRLLTFAAERKLIRKVPSFKHFEDRQRTAIIEPWLEDLMLDHAREPLRTVIIIMLDSFMRPAEVVAMRWEDVHFDRGQIWIPASKTKQGRRWIGVTARMRSAILSSKGNKCSSGWVFQSTGSKSGRRSALGHLLASSLDKPFREMKARITAAHPEIQWPEGLVLYSCRHTGATHYSDAVGNNQFKVANALGHSDLQTTRRYVHHANDSARVMDNVLEMRKKRA